ncbi:MAG: hypothetical protein ACI8RD_014134, partial [Bacillariaceae sp.]
SVHEHTEIQGVLFARLENRHYCISVLLAFVRQKSTLPSACLM